MTRALAGDTGTGLWPGLLQDPSLPGSDAPQKTLRCGLESGKSSRVRLSVVCSANLGSATRGPMDVTKPCEFIGFGAMDVTKPYKFIGLGAMDVTKTYNIFSSRTTQRSFGT